MKTTTGSIHSHYSVIKQGSDELRRVESAREGPLPPDLSLPDLKLPSNQSVCVLVPHLAPFCQWTEESNLPLQHLQLQQRTEDLNIFPVTSYKTEHLLQASNRSEHI